jgi:hypothetical protein
MNEDEISNSVTNVLQDHRIRNRANHPPQVNRLSKAAQRQSALTSIEEDLEGVDDDEEEEEEEEDNDQPKRRAPRNSKGTGVAKETNLGYYPAAWQSLLQDAKTEYHLKIAMGKFFSSKSNKADIECVKVIIMDKIAEALKNDDICLENGRFK